MSHDSPVVTLLVALISAGLLTYLRDAVKAFRARRAAGTPAARDSLHVAEADKSLLVVARSRDQLEQENERLRKSVSEREARHDAERARWEAREAAQLAEIESLQERVREFLAELEALKTRRIPLT